MTRIFFRQPHKNHHPSNVSFFMLMLLCGLFSVGGSEVHAAFTTETVDGAGSDVGDLSALAIDKDGNLHVSYRDLTNADLRYIKRTGSSWGSPTTVDSAGNVGWYTSLAVDGSGNPHISYYDWTNQDLKYAKYNGVSWSISTIDSAGVVGWYTSIIIDGSGNPHISYYDYTNQDLKYAKFNGVSWSISTLDSAGNTGNYTSIVIDGSGNPHISYQDETNFDLKYAKYNGVSWSISTIDSAGDVGRNASLALDGSGNPHISYRDNTNGDLKYAKFNGASWAISTIDSTGVVGEFASIALDGSGNPHISYYDWTNQDLKYAKYNGASWSISTLDSAGNTGNYTSIVIDGSGNPHISYWDATNGDLKAAHWTGAGFPAPVIAPADTTPPISRITAPMDNSFHTSLITISGTASDALSPLSKVEVSIKDETTLKFWNGAGWVETESWVQAQGLENWSIVPPAGSGHSYFAKSRAWDKSGNIESPYNPNGDSWKTLAPMSIARYDAATGVIEGKLYVAGGAGIGGDFAALEVYDPLANTWATKAPMPTARHVLAAGVIGGKLYVVGGYRNEANGGTPLSMLEVYDPATDTWAKKASMPTARYGLAASVINDKLYVVGGFGTSDLATLEVYDPTTDTWTKKASMPTARRYLAASAIEGKLYVVGGGVGQAPGGNTSIFLPTLEVYDPVTDTWTKKASMPTARWALAAGAADGMLYAAGGAGSGDNYLKQFEIYNPATDAWAVKSPLLTGRADLSAAVINERFYAIGGYNGNFLSTPEVYTPSQASGGVRYTYKVPLPAATTSPAASVSFTTETVDEVGINVGGWSSIAVDKNGNLHVSYYDGTNGDLRYIKRTGSAWGSPITVDSAGDVGYYTSIAIDGSGNPHISYHDYTNGDLKYAKYDGASWSISTIDSSGKVGYYTSIAIDGSGNPHISYQYGTNADLKYAKYDGVSWSISTIDSGYVGWCTSIAIDGSGNPHISYWEYTNGVYHGALKYAKYDGASWSISTIDSSGVGADTSIAIDGSGNPHISYLDHANYDLKYAKYNGSSWSISTIDSAGDMGRFTSLAIDGSGNPHISYHNYTNGDLKYAKYNGVSWSISTVDSAGNVGTYTSIAIDGSGNPHISYYDGTNGDLKVAHWTGTPFPAPQPAYQPPSALPLPPTELEARPVSQSGINLSWNLSASTDVTAYHVYLGTKDIFSQPAAALSSSATFWIAQNLSAGVLYQFAVRAENKLGEEKNTNILSAAPLANSHNFCSAGIKVPYNGKKVSGESLTVVAESSCGGEAASVRFEVQPATGTAWSLLPASNQNHPNPDTTFPYFVHWNVSALSPGEYHLRAVAKSKEGKDDPMPGFITIFVNHSDPDVLESGLTKVEKVGNHKENVIQAGIGNQMARIEIPAGSLSNSETKLTLKLNPSSLPSAPGLVSANSAVSVELENGQHNLGNEASLTLPYEEASGVEEKSLSAYYFNEEKKIWERLSSSVDTERNIVTVKTNHFSLFGLFAPAGASAPQSEAPFILGDAYIFPNPSRGSQNPIFHIEVGEADEVEVFIYDVSGALVETLRTTSSPSTINGTLAYEIPWTPSASGIYVALIQARKAGEADIRLSRKFGVIK